MRVIYCIPTCNPERASTAVAQWHARGYEVFLAVERDGFDELGADLVQRSDSYPGYWVASNRLAKLAVAQGADIVVCGGDDMTPDPNLAAYEIGAQYLDRFPDGFGIMQPTGDPMAHNCASRICGSPWMGRGWVERSYHGEGPFWGGYMQFFGDQELQHVAILLKCLWQRSDLTQWHDHWMRKGVAAKTDYQVANDRHWDPDKSLYQRRFADGFPNHEPRGL